MTTRSYCLAISHTPWIPERVASLERLRDSLEGQRVSAHIVDDKLPNSAWSEKMWRWAAYKNADWCVFLQDDSLVAPEFFNSLHAMLDGKTSRVIGLHVAHPAARPLAFEGFTSFTTSDGIVGVGYAVRHDALVEFLEWRANALLPGAVEKVTEDSLLGLWCAVTGEKVTHPIPALVDHDVSIPSVYGNDSHPHRTSAVRWDEDISRGNVQVDTPHFGCFYEATPRLAKRWVKNLPEETHQRLLADQGLVAKRKLRYYKLARAVEPQARVVICTPSKGFYHRECALSLRALSNVIGVDFKCEVDLEGIFYRDADVVRARSLLVSLFLRTDATHLLFLDDDISFTPDVVLGMLRAGKDFVAAPYPRRDELRLSEVRKNPNVNELVSAYRYTLHPLGEELCVMPDGTAEVKAMPLGCALLSRNMLEQMTAHFANSLRFSDKKCGDSVALFSLIHEGDQLWSEDHSFCLRWRALGGKVWMYLGEGSPVTHHGSYAFRGSVESFGVRRA